MLIRYGTDKKGRPVKKAVIYTKQEHKINIKLIDRDAIFVINRLKETGFEAYIVGGAVRDLILGRKPKDFDIVTDATPTKLKRIFKNSRIIGKRFRLVHIFFDDKIFETSTFRSLIDGSVGNSFGTIEEDVQRRDFTLNALYYNPLNEQVIDYVGGFNDIKKHIVKPIIELDRIFVDDPVRMIRAIKYSVTTKSKIPHSLKKKIKHSAILLSPVSPSRLTEELLKIFNTKNSREIVELALDLDLYIYLQPSATDMILNNKKFCEAYLKNLSALDDFVLKNPDCRLGEKLYFIIKDFVLSINDFSKMNLSSEQISDIYKTTWASCRNFILPMNPPRVELDFAVKKILEESGIKFNSRKKRDFKKNPKKSKVKKTEVKKES